MANATFQLSESASSVNLTLPDVSGTLLVDANILARVVASSPQWYKRQSLPTVTKDTVTIPAGLQININDHGFISSENVTLNTSSLGAKSGLAGKDVYIYAVIDSGALGFVLSLNSTVPDGYNAQNSRKIGGFHCLCVAVGTIADHPLSGYVAGDILPASLWDLLHRPKCEPEGMVYDSGLDLWIQIYLPSWDGSKLISRYRGVIVDGSSSHACHGESFAYEAGDMGGRLIRRDEFIHCMRGVPECVNIQGSADPNTTGGHVATNGQRIISNIGVEDGVGVLWQWGADTYDCYNGSGVSWSSTANFYLSGYSWQEKSVYNSSYDSVNRGSCYGLLRRALLGACWGDGACCGSRALYCSGFSSYGWSDYSARVVSEPRVVNL